MVLLQLYSVCAHAPVPESSLFGYAGDFMDFILDQKKLLKMYENVVTGKQIR